MHELKAKDKPEEVPGSPAKVRMTLLNTLYTVKKEPGCQPEPVVQYEVRRGQLCICCKGRACPQAPAHSAHLQEHCVQPEPVVQYEVIMRVTPPPADADTCTLHTHTSSLRQPTALSAGWPGRCCVMLCCQRHQKTVCLESTQCGTSAV